MRVLERTIRNGDTSPLISQPDRVVIYLNPCAWLVEDDDGGKYMESFRFGEPTWAPANTHEWNNLAADPQYAAIIAEH